MKYKSIAKQFVADIQSQKLLPGQRLPSLRQLTKQLDISMTTALNSYRSLEEMGWVVTYPKSGFFVATPISDNNTPHQPQFHSTSKSLVRHFEIGHNTSGHFNSGPFGVSQISPTHKPLSSLKRSIKRTIQRGDELLNSYADPQGVSALRNAIAEHYSAKGFAMAANDLFISNGCMDAIRIALLVTTRPGDAVAISSPCFEGLLKLLSATARNVVEIPCNADGVDLVQLESKLQNRDIKAVLLSSSYMNPHGISLSIQQKQKLAGLANKHRVPIIEDDVYSDLCHTKAFPLPIKYWDTNGYVLWCSSFSKSLASGLRLGWCYAGKRLDACIDLSTTESLSQNGLIQASVADFLESGEFRKHLHSVGKRLFSNAHAYRHFLLQNLPKGSAISNPGGGLVLWVQVPKLNDTKLRRDLDERKIDIRFGAQFTTRKLYRDCFRINIGWELNQQYDSKRTIKQALLELTQCVHNSQNK